MRLTLATLERTGLIFIILLLTVFLFHHCAFKAEESTTTTWATIKMPDGKIIEGEAEEVLHYIRFVDVTIDGETYTVNKSDVAFTKKPEDGSTSTALDQK